MLISLSPFLSLFQNNNRGGYNVGDRSDQAFDASKGTQGVLPPADTYNTANAVNGDANFNVQYQMVYYEGSQLSVEWTNQHGQSREIRPTARE